MKELERKIQNVEFDVETQYCDDDNCLHDCVVPSEYICDSHWSTWN